MSSYLECRQRVNFADLITFTRATEETGYNAAGNLVTFPAGTPAVPVYDPSTGEPLGLQVFEQRTNLLLWSNDLTQTGWNKSLGATTVISDVPTIDGVTFATRVSGLLGTDGDVGVQRFVSVSPSTSYNGSIYVKGEGANLGKKIQLRIKRVTGASVVVSKDVVLTDQWQRADLTITMLADNTQAQFGITRSTDIEANRADSCLVCYTQFEQGAFATPVIKTEATTATRNASVAVINDIDESEWWNASEGTFVVEWNEGNNLKSTGILVAGTGGITPSDAYFGLQKRISANYELTYMSTSSVGTVVSTGVPVTAGNHTATLRYIGNTVSLSVDGSAEISRTNVKRGQTILFIGLLLAGGTPLNGHIKSIIYYPSAGV